ncbi:hypothetical protein [Dethiobacter alkaliphilus]|uniref:hypothetical protein n=1 Tax=Dethiobacter alkaliphilus TaxID=427926 RepID=UPI002226593A|nr:hypothetical protein [Dethiobacter alkaliphilus]MCW3491535.1 hypothetical protein [Dethiobacter alkaliphilus]
MLQENELITKLQKSSMYCISFSDRAYLDVVLKEANIEKLVEFAAKIKEGVIFYKYGCYDIEDYLIPDSWVDDYPKNFVKKVNAHNRYLQSLEFDRPYYLVVFLIYNGLKIGFRDTNDWLVNENVFDAEEMIEELKAEYSEEIEKAREEKNKEAEKAEKEKNKQSEIMLGELREFILSDVEFHYCKNQFARYEYIRNLYEEGKYAAHLEFLMPFGAPHIGKVKLFMDKTWAIYQQRNRENQK